MIDGNQHHAHVAHMVGALSLVLSLASNVSPQERASDPSRAAFMKAHFSEAIVMHDAVARGDLPAAHAQATRLAQHRPAVPFPTGAHVFFGLMTIDAGKVRSANTVEEAGHAASSLLSRCGECHRAMHVASAVAPTPDLRIGGVVGQMLTHQRATDLLLEGVIGPSESAWDEGVRAFAGLRINPGDMAGARMTEKARIANARASSLAAAAAKAVTPPERAQAYGRILATCARCHQEHPGVWGPQR